jgi:hypothetical protein
MVEACNKRIIQSRSKRSLSMFKSKSMHLNQHVSQVLMRKGCRKLTLGVQPALTGSSIGHSALVTDVAVECVVGRPSMLMSMLRRN